MAPSSLQHRRTHNLLLVSKLLNQRDAASPFTLVLDSLEQSSIPLVNEYVKRAKAAKVKTILVSLETLKNTCKADIFISAWSETHQEWQKELAIHLKTEPTQRKLLIIDSLNTLSSSQPSDLPNLLSSFISPTTSLLAIYHTDIPSAPNTSSNPYAPPPLTLLKYLATTILTTYSLHHILTRKSARQRSRAEPSFGLEEGVEGVLIGLGANGSQGVVLDMEHRRKSGRGIREWYYLPIFPASAAQVVGKAKESVILLEDHGEYAKLDPTSGSGATQDENGNQSGTFELGLTEKQRLDREGVVLPYLDAQKGGGEGGRILYDMGSEDDFDEEEDEI